ncbi:MAG: 16S rRNA (uracil(1498)-N(3))-methyltransferase [Bacteroidota bacterium]
MSLFYEPAISSGVLFLNPEESRHCIKVLRKSVGDKITIIDGKGGSYLVKITNNNPKQCTYEIIEVVRDVPKDFHIHIALAPTKNIDRTEWFVEKAVEIGIDEISFIICTNSERRNINIDRVHKKVLNAAKQSLKATFPVINSLQPIGDFIENIGSSHKYIAYVDFDNPKVLSKLAPANSNYCVLIGPEGDFSSDELSLAIENNFKKVSLGPSRLRTETAGLVACHSLNSIQY